MPISAIIFDFDGTLVDTETATFGVWQEIFGRHGLTLELDLWQAAIGTRGGFDPYAYLASRVSPAVVEGLRQDIESRIRWRCSREALRPGVMSWLESARGEGLTTAVVSSSSAAWVEGWIVYHGIGDQFDHLVSGDQVQRVKPAPDLYDLAADLLRVPAECCLVVEDSPNGAQAAHAAGMHCVVVLNALTKHLRCPAADLVLNSFRDATLPEVAAQFGGAHPAPRAFSATGKGRCDSGQS